MLVLSVIKKLDLVDAQTPQILLVGATRSGSIGLVHECH